MPLEFEILNFRFEIGFRLKGIAEDRTCLALELICTEFDKRKILYTYDLS